MGCHASLGALFHRQERCAFTAFCSSMGEGVSWPASLLGGTCHQAREHLHTVSSFIWKNDNERCLYHPMKIELANSKKSLMVSFQARSSKLKNGIRHHCQPAGEPHFGLTGRWRVVGQSLRSKSFADLLQQRLAKKTSCLKDS